jgi:putative hydrolase of the HAD superfamily
VAVRAVFFDFDGVLTRDKTGSLTTLRFLASATGIPRERLQEAFRPHNTALNLGRVTHAEVWPAICACVGRDIDPRLLDAAYDSTPFNDGMLAAARELKRRYAVGIITDNKSDRMERIERKSNLAAVFDPIVVSSRIGADKTSATIFRRALDLARTEAGEALFIDNSPENLVAARHLGMQVLHFDDEANDVAGLRTTLRDRFELELEAPPGAREAGPGLTNE